MSRLLKAEFIIKIEKGIINNVWPRTTLQRFSGNPSWISTIKRETPTIISGRTRGAKINVSETCFPGNWYRLVERDASVPRIVAKILDDVATISEFLKASCKVSWYNSASNQPVVNPDNGKAIIWLELNEKIGRRSAGAYKKIK